MWVVVGGGGGARAVYPPFRECVASSSSASLGSSPGRSGREVAAVEAGRGGGREGDVIVSW